MMSAPSAVRFRPLRLLAFLLFLLLLLELTARVFCAVQRRSVDPLFFPATTQAAIELARTEPAPVVALPDDHDGMKDLKESLKGRMRLPPGPCRFYAADGSSHLVPINRSGFRGKDFSDRAGARRVLVTMGESSTFCAECPAGQSWPERLEARLNERLGSNAVCVINRSMLGMRPDEVANLFCGEIVAQPVDLALVCCAFNALEPPIVVDLRPGMARWITRLLWGRSLLYTTLYNHRLARDQARADDEARRMYRADLERMVDAARRHSIALLFVLQPLLEPSRQAVEGDVGYTPAALARRQVKEIETLLPLHNELLAVMSAVARESGVALCDPRPAVLEGEAAPGHFVLCIHLTPAGADRMAGAVAENVADLLESTAMDRPNAGGP
jgi:hypothetical protein